MLNGNTQVRSRFSWGLTIVCWLLTLVFLAAGGAKLTGAEMVVRQFEGWGYAGWFVGVVGAIEVMGAIALAIPFSRLVGAFMLTVVMIGAAGTHALFGEWARLPTPIVIFALLVWIIQKTAKQYQKAELATRDEAHVSP